MVSRWAPASEPPTMARGSCHVSTRSTQSCSDSPMGGRRPVRSPSATTTSSSASKGALARYLAHGPSLDGRVLGGERLLEDQALPHSKMPQDARLLRLRPCVEAAPRLGVRERSHPILVRE